MLLSIFNLIFTGLEIPDTPGSDDLHIRCKSLYCKLETNLVITLTCAAVADCICALSLCNFNNPLCDCGTCKGCTEKIISLVNSACPYCGINVILNKLLVEIFNVEL